MLIKVVHCLEKWELKILAFCLFPWKIGGITGIFLSFKNVFNMDQYVLGLVLGSNKFFATFD